MKAMDVVIVHYHAALRACEAVSALRADAATSDMSLNIIVADNGSTREERELLRSQDVVYVDVGRNAGYAGALSAVFPLTRSDFLVVMNEDVLVLPGCLRTLQSSLMTGAAIAGPEFYWDRECALRLPCTEERTRRNELMKIAGRSSLAGLARARAHWREHARRHWRSIDPMRTTALSGALLAFRRDTWSAIGPLDDAFHLYFEENDWLHRADRAGLECLLVPAAKAVHLHNPMLATSAERTQMYAKSFALFGCRYYGERFMDRLFRLSACESVTPDWPPLHEIPIDLGDSHHLPLWLEVTPSALGFPAATMCMTDPELMPAMRGLEFAHGPLYLQIVDDAGRELCRYSFHKPQIRDTTASRQRESLTV
jgi:GT2 family glycosyltransferase